MNMKCTRRQILSTGVAATVLSFVPKTRCFAGTRRTGLPVPQELRPDATGTIALRAISGTTNFLMAAQTRTYGYNGNFLGPALRVRRGQNVKIDFTNHLSEITTLHWHGLIIPGEVDGGPHMPVARGKSWHPSLSIDQPAATLWFHPHFYPTTAAQVIKGLAGLLIIDDDETDRLALPSRWGINDIPVIIQDRRFTPDGQFFYKMNLTAITYGYVGDVPLVNGAHYPEAHTTQSWIRLRLLDGSNARSYTLKTSDARSLFVIGSDGGLFQSPVEVNELTIHPGERFEIMIDCRSGVPFDLVSAPTGAAIMRLPPFDADVPLMTIRPDGAESPEKLPSEMVTLPDIPEQLPTISQRLIMNMFEDKKGMATLKKAGLPPLESGVYKGQNLPPDVISRITNLIVGQPQLSAEELLSANGINGASFATGEPGFGVQREQVLLWRLSEGTGHMLHPVHIHGCQFRIVSESGKPPQAYRAGWKDIAPITGGGYSDILVRFPHEAGSDTPYMAHCHILEHEDSGMMTQFVVS